MEIMSLRQLTKELHISSEWITKIASQLSFDPHKKDRRGRRMFSPEQAQEIKELHERYFPPKPEVYRQTMDLIASLNTPAMKIMMRTTYERLLRTKEKQLGKKFRIRYKYVFPESES